MAYCPFLPIWLLLFFLNSFWTQEFFFFLKFCLVCVVSVSSTLVTICSLIYVDSIVSIRYNHMFRFKKKTIICKTGEISFWFWFMVFLFSLLGCWDRLSCNRNWETKLLISSGGYLKKKKENSKNNESFALDKTLSIPNRRACVCVYLLLYSNYDPHMIVLLFLHLLPRTFEATRST